jgi:zinc transporter ZupT
MHQYLLGWSLQQVRHWYFFVKGMNRRLLDTMLGFTGGVMVAASFWSLLAPAIEIQNFPEGLAITSPRS